MSDKLRCLKHEEMMLNHKFLLKALIEKAHQNNPDAQFLLGKYFLKHHKPNWAKNLLEMASLYGNLEAEKYLHCISHQIGDCLNGEAV